MIKNVDIVTDLSWGDTGKGKVISWLSKNSDIDYNYVCRWAGGNNAGHTVYIGGKRYKTHLIPSGVFHGIKSIIGPGCVVHPDSLYKELSYIKDNGFDPSLVKVSPRAHIVKEEHIQEDKSKLASKLGTTSKGIAPCYASKMARTGLLARDSLSSKLLWNEELSGNILCEGAQGFYLDVDYGNYPYVTSSNTLPYAACSLGFPPQKIRKIWGLCKMYDTRSGKDTLFPENLLDDKELSELCLLGEEVGVTTGRRRKCNWLNLNYLINAINITGTTDLIVNKCDILKKSGHFKIIYNEEILSFFSFEHMRSFIEDTVVRLSGDLLKEITFSYSPERI